MSLAHLTIRRLGPADVPLVRKLNVLFGDAFAEPETYGAEPPSDAYLEGLLAKDHVLVVVAQANDEVLGGLVAYELDKFERERRGLYIYDLAVGEKYRRRGIATALIAHLREIAAQRGAWVIYVQADHGAHVTPTPPFQGRGIAYDSPRTPTLPWKGRVGARSAPGWGDLC